MPYSPPLRLCIMLAVAIVLTLSCTDSPKPPALTGRVNDLANIPPTVPALTGRVNDFANVLTDIERDTLEQDLIQFKNSSGAILVLVTANSFQPFPSIGAFANELFKNDGRGIGDARRNNGLLVVLAVEDRQVRVTTGLGMEQIVTDRAAADVSQQMTLEFRRGEYAQGLKSGVAALRRLFDAHYGR